VDKIIHSEDRVAFLSNDEKRKKKRKNKKRIPDPEGPDTLYFRLQDRVVEIRL